MKMSLLTLFPYDDNHELNSCKQKLRVLNTIKFYYQSILNAIESFLSKKTYNFDAQVSENLCQIRALQLIMFYDEYSEHIKQLTEFQVTTIKKHRVCDDFITLCENFLSRKVKDVHSIVSQPVKLNEFIEVADLNIPLSEMAAFLLHAYILSRYKLVGQYHISSGINYPKLCEELKISSKTYAKKIAHTLQRSLSKLSLELVLELAAKDNSQYLLQQTLNHLKLSDEVGRAMLPCYEATKVILDKLLYERKAIKVVAHRIAQTETDKVSFILESSLNKMDFSIPVEDRETLTEEPIAMFIGVVRYNSNTLESQKNYIKRFLTVGFRQVILFNMAQHDQYAGLVDSKKKSNPYLDAMPEVQELEIKKHMSSLEMAYLRDRYLSGCVSCAKKSPYLFLLTHAQVENPSHADEPLADCTDGARLVPTL